MFTGKIFTQEDFQQAHREGIKNRAGSVETAFEEEIFMKEKRGAKNQPMN